jgi:hypothetical protein
MHAPSRTRRIVVTVLALVAAACLVIAIAVFLIVSRYMETVPLEADTAHREFATASARLTGPAPLVEYRGFEAPVIRRRPGAATHELHTLHVLAYDADEGELTRGAFPVSVLRTVTLGGWIRLMHAGGADGRITLDDLERHGPGLVLDSRGGTPGILAVADAVLGTKSTQSRFLIWTE